MEYYMPWVAFSIRGVLDKLGIQYNIYNNNNDDDDDDDEDDDDDDNN